MKKHRNCVRVAEAELKERRAEVLKGEQRLEDKEKGVAEREKENYSAAISRSRP